MVFEDSQTLAILELDRPPRFPGSPGGARLVGAEDDTVFSAFMTAFLREAAPHDPVPSAERIASDARSGRYLFWTVDDVPVSMAGKVREQRPSAPSLAFTPRRSAAVAVTLAP